jgi:hypothetical protein
MTGWQIALFLLCAALATCAQTLTGFAFALVLLGLAGMFHLAPLPDLANVATVLALANAAMALRGSARTLDFAAFRDIAIGSALGVATGLLLLDWLSANTVIALRLLLGLTVIACAVVVLLEAAALRTRSGAHVFRGYGLLSGVLGGLFAAGGPPLVYHLYRQPLPLRTIRDTLMATLAASSLFRLLVVVPTGQFSANAGRLCLLAAPVVFGLSWWLERHPPGWARPRILKLVCALLLFTGAGLALPAAQQLLGAAATR